MDSKSGNKENNPPSLVDNLKKLQDDMIANYDPKIFSEICNLVKTKGEIPFENLNLKNPDHLKLIEQVYNPEALQSLINRSKHETSKAFHSTDSSHKGSTSFEDHSSSHKSDTLGFSVKKEHQDYKPYQSALHSSPMPNKEMGLYNSPRHTHQTKSYNCDDFFNDENVNNANYLKSEHYGETFIYSSPMPQKKVKATVAMSPNLLALEELKSDSKNRDRSAHKALGEWNKGNKGSYNQPFTKDIFGGNSLFYSPINIKYESPSK